MSELQRDTARKTPWHLWLVGIAALLWNSIGAMDYVMTQTKNESYMSGFTPEQLSFFYEIPAWAAATRAIGVWGGVVGAIFLLLRKGVAVWIFFGLTACNADDNISHLCVVQRYGS